MLDRTIAFTASRLDKFLKKYVAPAAGIEKILTMHITRHTFGNIAGDTIPVQMLQKLYRHSHIETTALSGRVLAGADVAISSRRSWPSKDLP